MIDLMRATRLLAAVLALACGVPLEAAADSSCRPVESSGNKAVPTGGLCVPPAAAVASMKTEPSVAETYAMVSAYNLEPYSPSYLTNALASLKRARSSGIVYTSIGEISAKLAARGINYDEIELNRGIYEEAASIGVPIWLQVRIYSNQLSVGGRAPRNYTADELVGDPEVRQAFTERLTREFGAYNKIFQGRCVVVVFEEAGIYHSPQGGGYFWSSSTERIRPSYETDAVFANKFAAVYGLVHKTIKGINPSCRIGPHVGHSVFRHKDLFAKAIADLRAQQSGPAFVFYDLYLKSHGEPEKYEALLADRAGFVINGLGLPIYYLAQLHTMNNFQKGLGRTPSRSEIDGMVALARRLRVSGLGFYSKNATRTASFDNHPFDPNSRGQATVLESSPDRWDYGLQKLLEARGVDYRTLVDLFLDVDADNPVRIELFNWTTNRWLVQAETGAQGSPGRGGRARRIAIRNLALPDFAPDGHRLTVRVSSGSAGGDAGAAVHGLVAPTLPSQSFVTRAAWVDGPRGAGLQIRSFGQIEGTVPFVIGGCTCR